MAQQLGIEHHVFNLTDEFDRSVVTPYVDAHAAGRTPNPCIECNRSVKFDLLVRRADRLGFDYLATGHHARVTADAPGSPDGPAWRLRRGADAAKDQSYVLSMLGQDTLARVVFPVGDMTKGDVRTHAARLGLRTAAKPDSQDVCFIGSAEGRQGFLAERIALHPAEVVDTAGRPAGSVEAVELVTVGQRRGMGHGSDGTRRYVTHVDVAARRVIVGGAEDVLRSSVVLPAASLSWVDRALHSRESRRSRRSARTAARSRALSSTTAPTWSSASTRRSAPWRPVRRWRSTTRRSRMRWSARASRPDHGADGDWWRLRRGERRERVRATRRGGTRRGAARADPPSQRAVQRARRA